MSPEMKKHCSDEKLGGQVSNLLPDTYQGKLPADRPDSEGQWPTIL